MEVRAIRICVAPSDQTVAGSAPPPPPLPPLITSGGGRANGRDNGSGIHIELAVPTAAVDSNPATLAATAAAGPIATRMMNGDAACVHLILLFMELDALLELACVSRQWAKLVNRSPAWYRTIDYPFAAHLSYATVDYLQRYRHSLQSLQPASAVAVSASPSATNAWDTPLVQRPSPQHIRSHVPRELLHRYLRSTLPAGADAEAYTPLTGAARDERGERTRALIDGFRAAFPDAMPPPKPGKPQRAETGGDANDRTRAAAGAAAMRRFYPLKPALPSVVRRVFAYNYYYHAIQQFHATHRIPLRQWRPYYPAGITPELFQYGTDYASSIVPTAAGKSSGTGGDTRPAAMAVVTATGELRPAMRSRPLDPAVYRADGVDVKGPGLVPHWIETEESGIGFGFDAYRHMLLPQYEMKIYGTESCGLPLDGTAAAADQRQPPPPVSIYEQAMATRREFERVAVESHRRYEAAVAEHRAGAADRKDDPALVHLQHRLTEADMDDGSGFSNRVFPLTPAERVRAGAPSTGGEFADDWVDVIEYTRAFTNGELHRFDTRRTDPFGSDRQITIRMQQWRMEAARIGRVPFLTRTETERATLIRHLHAYRDDPVPIVNGVQWSDAGANNDWDSRKMPELATATAARLALEDHKSVPAATTNGVIELENAGRRAMQSVEPRHFKSLFLGLRRQLSVSVRFGYDRHRSDVEHRRVQDADRANDAGDTKDRLRYTTAQYALYLLAAFIILLPIRLDYPNAFVAHSVDWTDPTDRLLSWIVPCLPLWLLVLMLTVRVVILDWLRTDWRVALEAVLEYADLRDQWYRGMQVPPQGDEEAEHYSVHHRQYIIAQRRWILAVYLVFVGLCFASIAWAFVLTPIVYSQYESAVWLLAPLALSTLALSAFLLVCGLVHAAYSYAPRYREHLLGHPALRVVGQFNGASTVNAAGFISVALVIGVVATQLCLILANLNPSSDTAVGLDANWFKVLSPSLVVVGLVLLFKLRLVLFGGHFVAYFLLWLLGGSAGFCVGLMIGKIEDARVLASGGTSEYPDWVTAAPWLALFTPIWVGVVGTTVVSLLHPYRRPRYRSYGASEYDDF